MGCTVWSHTALALWLPPYGFITTSSRLGRSGSCCRAALSLRSQSMITSSLCARHASCQEVGVGQGVRWLLSGAWRCRLVKDYQVVG